MARRSLPGDVGALIAVEQRTLRLNGPLAGVALRYGFFYGPGTWFHPDGDVAAQLRAGLYPVLGTGAGRWSFVHIDDAVAATVAAVESDLAGAFNICDDDPSPSANGCPLSPGTWGRRRQRICRSGQTGIRTAGSTASCSEGPTTTSLVSELGFDPRPLPWR